MKFFNSLFLNIVQPKTKNLNLRSLDDIKMFRLFLFLWNMFIFYFYLLYFVGFNLILYI